MRDHRQLLMHCHRLVQIRTRVKNELQHLILNQGMQKSRNCGARTAGQRSRHYRWSHGQIDAGHIH